MFEGMFLTICFWTSSNTCTFCLETVASLEPQPNRVSEVCHKSNHGYKAPLTSSRSVKFMACRSLSSSAWSGTDICVLYFTWGKEWGVRALLRPAPGVDSGEMSLVSRLSDIAENFFLFFSVERLALFCWTPQSWENGKSKFTNHKWEHSLMNKRSISWKI